MTMFRSGVASSSSTSSQSSSSNISAASSSASSSSALSDSTPNHHLHELLVKLHKLGEDLPQILIYLTQIASPKLPLNLLIPVLGQMFEGLPPFLSKTEPSRLAELIQQTASSSGFGFEPAEFTNLFASSPDIVHLRILLDLSEIQQILAHISVLQLLHLTNNTIPPGPQENQETFIKKVQEAFQSWSPETLERYHNVLAETPLHLERQQLLQLDSQIPWEILHLIIELLKLPMEELYSFQQWITKLPPHHIRVLVQLLQIESSTLLEIKRRIAPSPPPPLFSLSSGLISSTSSASSSSSSLPLNVVRSTPAITITDDKGSATLSSALVASPSSLMFSNSPSSSPSSSFLSSLLNGNGSSSPTRGSGKKRLHEDLFDDQSIQEDLELIGSGAFTMDVDPLLLYPDDLDIAAALQPSSLSQSTILALQSLLPASPSKPSSLAASVESEPLAVLSSGSTSSSAATSLPSILISSTDGSSLASSSTTIPTLASSSSSTPTALTSSSTAITRTPLLKDLVEPFSFVPHPPSSENKFQIRIARQPPPKTVYQRILKPFPSVMLLMGQDNDSNLFVEAQLIRSDNEQPLPRAVDGNRIVRISNGIFATFKKLKILSTSQQQGTLFRLRFVLKRYAGSQASFEDIPNCTIISNPIEVFSHTQYLNEKQDGTSLGLSSFPFSLFLSIPPLISHIYRTTSYFLTLLLS
ncbi:DNA repair protein rad10 domain-containing protein, variant 2 [Balamuthia mandrillaris]